MQNWKGEFMKRSKKGSLTVEASIIFPLGIMITGMVISLWIYSYQRCWYTQAACETAMYGSRGYGLEENQRKIQTREKWNILKTLCYPKLEYEKSGIEEAPQRIKVFIKGHSVGILPLKIQIQCEQRIPNPVRRICRIKAWTESGGEKDENGV